MTPKEKADELVEKFIRVEDDTSFYWECYYDERLKDNEIKPHAIKCALIAVEEILKLELQEPYKNNNYWQEVKQELLKMK